MDETSTSKAAVNYSLILCYDYNSSLFSLVAHFPPPRDDEAALGPSINQATMGPPQLPASCSLHPALCFLLLSLAPCLWISAYWLLPPYPLFPASLSLALAPEPLHPALAPCPLLPASKSLSPLTTYCILPPAPPSLLRSASCSMPLLPVYCFFLLPASLSQFPVSNHLFPAFCVTYIYPSYFFLSIVSCLLFPFSFSLPPSPSLLLHAYCSCLLLSGSCALNSYFLLKMWQLVSLGSWNNWEDDSS